MKKRLLALAVLSATALTAHASISIGSSSSLTYSQTFDSLASSGTANVWLNNSTLPGWSLFNAAGAALTTYRADNTNTGSFYSFGLDSDRALGGVGSGNAYFAAAPSGAVAGYIAAAFTNTGATMLSSFSLSYSGEQWRNGGNTGAQTMTVQYGFGDSFAAVSAWTNASSSFAWSSPITGATAAVVDGNNAGLVSNVGGTVSDLTWEPGQTLWLRWVETNDVGNDHSMAIDNVSLSFTSAVPEPSSYALLLAGLGVVGMLARRRGSSARQA